MLECSNISCIRGSRLLFKNLSFTANRGSIMSITGRNGSGKTSLLRVIMGLIPLTSGSVKLYGEDITISSTCISHITYVGHKNACNEYMTVAEILAFWAYCKNTPELIDAASYFFGLYPILNTRFEHLSSGWKRRVALSRLLVVNTHVWIVDEPFANLDIASTALVQDLILARAEQGGIVVVADHTTRDAFSNAQVVQIPALDTVLEE